jgi:transposase
MSGSISPNLERNSNIIRLVESGKTFSQVAKALNLTRSTVAGVVGRSKGRVTNPGAPRNRRLSDDQVTEIRNLCRAGEKLAYVAHLFGVSESMVCLIKNRRRRFRQGPPFELLTRTLCEPSVSVSPNPSRHEPSSSRRPTHDLEKAS